jgi:hypothetical protein
MLYCRVKHIRIRGFNSFLTGDGVKKCDDVLITYRIKHDFEAGTKYMEPPFLLFYRLTNRRQLAGVRAKADPRLAFCSYSLYGKASV